MSHTGNSEDMEKIDNLMQNNPLFSNLMMRTNMNALQNTNPENELINKYPIDQDMNTIIFLAGGKLILQDSLLSLSFIVKSFKNILPALVCIPGSDLVMQRCEVKGNQNHETIGLMIRMANANISDCRIHNNLMGGVLVWTKENNRVKISHSKILFNSKAGIHCVGHRGTTLIHNNRIESNSGSGIKVGIANKATIINNEIKLNHCGVEVVSGEPLITHNNIEKNYNDGVYTTVHEDIRCDAIIKGNEISGNKENGVNCSGNMNLTRIEDNRFIGYNKMAGVKGDNYARISVTNNTISKNLG